jgi:adenylate kinase family enzyme
VGSGKTTLAKEISTTLNIPYFEIDNIVWKRHPSGDIRRTDEERAECLKDILQTDNWIIEGVHSEPWIAESFQKADVIIYLDTKYSVRTYRIIRRFILQKLGLEKAHYKPTFKIFLKMFKWNKHFEEIGKPRFFKNFEMYREKIIVITNTRELKHIFQ